MQSVLTNYFSISGALEILASRVMMLHEKRLSVWLLMIILRLNPCSIGSIGSLARSSIAKKHQHRRSRGNSLGRTCGHGYRRGQSPAPVWASGQTRLGITSITPLRQSSVHKGRFNVRMCVAPPLFACRQENLW
jgi:hypothetical protein